MSTKCQSAQRLLAKLYPKKSMPQTVSKHEFRNHFKNGEFSPVFGEITCQGGSELIEHALSILPPQPSLIDLGSGFGRFCLYSALTYGDSLESIHGIELSPDRHAVALSVLEQLNLQKVVDFKRMNLLDFPLGSFREPLILYCASLTFSEMIVNKLQKRIEEQVTSPCLVYTCREMFFSTNKLKFATRLCLETSWSPKAQFHVYRIN